MSEIGRWTITTERSREAERRGLGRSDLLVTLRHLRVRGDLRATVDYAVAGAPVRRVEVSLVAPPVPSGFEGGAA